MSVHPSVSVNELPAEAAAQADTFESPALRNTMRNQRLQDFFFHKVTWLFAASVLAVLAGIIVSLAIGAAPAFKEFGLGFIKKNRKK
jgi:phosphate transport system permease protein